MRSHLSRRWIWIVLVVVIAALVLPMIVAERYTSTTQDGQYMGHPWRSIRFLVAAILVSPSSDLSTSGKALARAKDVFSGTAVTPVRVELLFFPSPDRYTYSTKSGQQLTIDRPGRFVWEVWGTVADAPADQGTDVVALLDYGTGQVLDSVVPPR
jgi:hypothetical protein